MASDYDLLVILGPTASGKTTLAAALASELGTEIISADSRQVYRHMDIGTGKDLSDYVVNGRQVPYHLIDIVEPGYKYNLFEYQRDFLAAYRDMRQRGLLPVVCGGTGALPGGRATGLPAGDGAPEPGLACPPGRKIAGGAYGNPTDLQDAAQQDRCRHRPNGPSGLSR